MVPLLRDDLERRIVRLAIPALGTLAVEPVYVLVDTAIVGRLGTPQLAGMAIASIVLLNLVSLLLLLGSATLTLNLKGTGDDEATTSVHLHS